MGLKSETSARKSEYDREPKPSLFTHVLTLDPDLRHPQAASDD